MIALLITGLSFQIYTRKSSNDILLYTYYNIFVTTPKVRPYISHQITFNLSTDAVEIKPFHYQNFINF